MGWLGFLGGGARVIRIVLARRKHPLWEAETAGLQFSTSQGPHGAQAGLLALSAEKYWAQK